MLLVDSASSSEVACISQENDEDHIVAFPCSIEVKVGDVEISLLSLIGSGVVGTSPKLDFGRI
ncbi:3742_t:CDS:2 [Funneliformis mosseae]|uniref:3742_t:CDS:1 n=1 Tax=Funneliformis mosseae TaxID=27381 RepID=A0A9N9BVN7_FUNMO|nr:3742_t:CDS:2 [Funneliformis mosseae]